MQDAGKIFLIRPPMSYSRESPMNIALAVAYVVAVLTPITAAFCLLAYWLERGEHPRVDRFVGWLLGDGEAE